VFSRFFIERPIFANVIALVTMLIGGVALIGLPIEQYPEITPPTIRVSAVYPGANAAVVADTVAAPIEQQVNGVENMLYMSSTSSGDGSYSLTVTFEIGTNLDDAQVQVQNRIAIAEPQLPEEVRRQGVTVKKQSTNIIIVASLLSENDRYDSIFLSNYANLRLRDELSRVEGVGDVTIFGANNYSMRVWLDPLELESRQLTTQDVIAAIQEQNVQVAAGALGQPPSPSGLAFQYTITAQGRLSDPEQFENIVVRSGAEGELTYLRDVARVELGAQTYDQFSLLNGRNTSNIGIFQLPGSNSLEVAQGVREAMERMSRAYPEGMYHVFPLDTTEFVEASIHEVYVTLFEAGILVLIVILVFLQDWRAVLIPATTVPVTIIGAFAAMYALGFSINMLTLFGLILAIGIVVDDAIVIVEAAAHNIEQGMKPKAATIRAMDQVLGPIIGITLVLMAVFLPSAFLGGITGQLYRQFALTIAATAVISAINAMTLKPAQCATWLRPVSARFDYSGGFGWFWRLFHPLAVLWLWFCRAFNWVYSKFEAVYAWIVWLMLKGWWAMMAAFVAIVAFAAWWYQQVPTGFLPVEDQGYIIVSIQLPDAASQERTRAVIDGINAHLDETEGVADYFAIGGFSFVDGAAASNAATYFITFDPFEERLEHDLPMEKILGGLQGHFFSIKEAMVFGFAPPPIRGLGLRAGFQMQVEDQGAAGLEELGLAVQEIIANASSQSKLAALNSSFRPGVPQLYIDVDRAKAKALGVPLSSVFNTLQANLGSAYVNDFNKFGRTYQVRVQAAQDFRMEIEDVRRLEVRSLTGQMIPMGSLATIERSFGPQNIIRYNLYPAAAVRGEPAPGVSSGEALRLMEEIAAATLPQSMGFEWTDASYQEKQVGGEAIWIFSLAVLLVYFVLAAQYESWILPFAVILVVPLGLLGAIGAVSLRGMDNNIYTQIGIVLIIALASKNAILIVEYARDLHNEGMKIFDAALKAARLRFRPILMTSFAFILGVFPLVIAEGAGAAGRQALGTAVFGGMIASTVLAVFFTPVFYFVAAHIADLWRKRDEDKPQAGAAEEQGPPDHVGQAPQTHAFEPVESNGDGQNGSGSGSVTRPVRASVPSDGIGDGGATRPVDESAPPDAPREPKN
jgi:HAE1 family hydrophobic/amphiphilic exporter-1